MSDSTGDRRPGHDGYAPPPPPSADAAAAQYAPPGSPPWTGQSDPAAAPPYGYPGYQRTNTLSIVAIILGFLVAPAGIICGHIALSQIKKSGEAGRPLALTGVIAGYVITGLYLAFFLFQLVIIAVFLGGAAFTPGLSA